MVEALTQDVPAVLTRKRNGWPVLVATAGVVLACGAAAWRLDVLGYGMPADVVDEVPAKRPEVGALLALDPFIANLADDDGKRYLKATVQLEFFAGRVPDAMNARLPQMRDLLLTLFTSKRFADIRTIEGKARLRDEIINRANRALRRDLVKAVYFTEFIVE
ncbi:MAG TPA: flagellar basal body-associated FliL family protein [Candidatus Binatia bacterium]|nr:flagellar basal body-associated FliL family protein [Candidatus Binatia bacterium]